MPYLLASGFFWFFFRSWYYYTCKVKQLQLSRSSQRKFLLHKYCRQQVLTLLSLSQKECLSLSDWTVKKTCKWRFPVPSWKLWPSLRGGQSAPPANTRAKNTTAKKGLLSDLPLSVQSKKLRSIPPFTCFGDNSCIGMTFIKEKLVLVVQSSVTYCNKL